MTIPENATYTAAEVKVLTEAALRLGRKEAGEEIAAALQEVPALWMANSSAFDDGIGRREAVRLAHDIASQPSPDATSGRTDPNSTSAMLKSLEGK